MARKQVLDGWTKLINSKATATFGFPELQAWAEKLATAAAAAPGAIHEQPPEFEDAFHELAKKLAPSRGARGRR